ncbi:MAG: DUF11 domain-containing protein [Chloroflexi bacterium]|nr:DUF11 domain-containing protein [Chloroflexota bacterium]MBP8058732.1 DUF11 domain-containing protein [Chloroflexota bacterium]
MFPHRHIIFIPILVALVAVVGLLGVLQPYIYAAPSGPLTQPDPASLFEHLEQERRLHWVVSGISMTAGTFVAPDGDWAYGGPVVNGGVVTTTEAYALQSGAVAVFRTSVQNGSGEDIAWENGDIASVFGDVLQNNLPTTVLSETQMTMATLAEVDILILPSFSIGFHDEVAAALGADGLAALSAFVNNGGFVYAQGQGQYLLEAAGLVAPGTVDVTTPITTNLGMLDVHDPTHPLTFNWETNSLWILDDPTLNITAPLTTIASYSNTVGGPQPAIVYGQIGQGQVVLVNGHPTSPLYRDQLNLFINGLLLGMAERGELHGRAIQTYAGNVPDNIIPAYEEGIPISVTLHFEHLWQGIALTNVVVTERVQEGFNVHPGSIAPLPSSIEITHTNGTTETIITWVLGDVSGGPITLHYTATTGVNTMAPGSRLFSYGAAAFGDGPRQVVWERPDFWLYPRMAARLEGEHDKEPDRFYTISEEGVYLDEFVFLENKEDTTAHAIGAVRFIPLIVPIVGLEEQREPLATNAGETVWMKNAFFVYDDPRYLWPEGMTAITETWDLDDWDGTTFITMTTPGGYHIDPIPFPLAENLGFFVTIPPSYTHMITVTANHELLLPALRVEWDLGDFPGYWYELPALRYGIHSTELFSRAVSFTGDPIVGSVVVDATGGSVYTGLGEDPLLYRDYLAPVEVHPPTAPITGSITYQDIWSRTHELPIRAGFYDVFNFASCGCGTGVGERHAALNVTFAIWVDTDGDGVKETMLTDFEEMKGLMPTRLEGDLDIIIKSLNLGTLIHSNENIIEGNIFRGLGFDIEPRYGSWADSYQSTYSTLISNTEQAAYHELIFQQSVPVNATDLITIHARFDPNNSLIEGMMKLHDGVRFVYRQNVAGEGQYEVIDTHVQGTVGVRSDAVIINYLTPAFASTYTDTFFVDYNINDWYESRAFVADPYQVSWGYGNLAATTYVGGREQRDLFHSIINLGDRTFLRVEVNNNSGVTLQNVSLAPVVPPGITVTQLYTDNVPVPLWPDLPFINVPNIPDASYGLYFFELQTSAVYTALLNTVQEIPIQFSATNAPAEFEIPPALLAIRGANGETPQYVSGYSHNLRGRDVLEPYITVQDIRLLNDDQMFILQQLVLSDISTIPHTNLAWAYYNTLTNTIPYTFSNGVLSYTVPITNLPWVDNGLETGVHVVAYNAISVTHSTRYPVNSGGVLTSTDDFEMDWVSTANPLFLEVRGANVNTLYNVTQITRTLTGQAAPFLYASEWNEVIIAAATTNEGNDVAANTFVTITVDSAFNLVNAPSNITIIPGGLLWDVGDLAPGASRQVALEFEVFAPLPTPFGPIVLGDMDAFTRSDGEFVNVFSGQLIQAQVGDSLNLAIGTDTTLLAETGLQAQVDTSPLYAGETATLYAQIVNNGPSAAANLVTTVTLPISLTNPVFSSSQGSCDPVTHVCHLLDLPVGAAAFITITAVTDLAAEGDLFVHFSHHSDALDINPNNNEATVMVTLLPAPADTALTAQATVNPVVAGDPVEIVIQTTTTGPGTAHQAILTPTLPVTLIDPVIVTTQGSCDSSTLICHLGELPVGTTVVLTVTANTNLNVAGTWPAHFVVGTSNLDTNMSNNEASLDLVLSPTPADAALSAQVTVNPVHAGEPVEIVVQATNSGPGTIQQGIFTPTLPISLTNPVIVTTQGSCNSATLVCNLGDIAIGQTVILTVTGNTSPGMAGIWPAHFAIGASNPDTNLTNNEATVEIEVVFVPTDVSLIALTGESSPYGLQLMMVWTLGALLVGVAGLWYSRKRQRS